MLKCLPASILAIVLSLPACAQTPATTSPTPAGCTSPESRQFDFWVGEWDVYAGATPDKQVATSRIENLYGGCAIRENWMPFSNPGGGSLSAYVPAQNGWRQTWVDTSGAFVDFTGAFRDGKMILEGVWPQPGKPMQITRMTYSVLGDGAVRQLGETSDDQGATWQPGFDFIYRRKAAP